MNRDLSSRSNKSRTLSSELAQVLVDRIRGGDYPPGTKLPKEASIMEEFGVSRTVVREAISSLQAVNMAETRHGIGTFVLKVEESAPFRIRPEQLGTLRDTIALLELRIGVETEAAAIAAARRTEANLVSMQAALDAFSEAIEAGQDAANADFQFHREIALATQNSHFGDQDVDSARAAIRTHLSNSRERLRKSESQAA